MTWVPSIKRELLYREQFVIASCKIYFGFNVYSYEKEDSDKLSFAPGTTNEQFFGAAKSQNRIRCSEPVNIYGD